MVGQVDFRLLDTSLPERAGGAFMEGRKNALAAEMLGYQADAARQQMEDDRAVKNMLAQSGGDLATASRNLLQAGQVKPALAIQKQMSDQQKAQMEAQKLKIETGLKSMEMIGQVVSSAKDQNSWDAARQQIAQIHPEAVANLPAAYDPMAISDLLKKAQPIKEQMANKYKEIDQSLNMAKFGYQQHHDAQQLGVTMRGQDLVNARAKEAAAAGKAPAGYRFNAEGNLEAIPGGPAEKDKALTEKQANATKFGARMTASAKLIEGLEKAGVNSAQVGTKLADSGWTNWMASDQGQQYNQAARDWLSANLRDESGAAIGILEENKDYRKFFPQIGDSKAVIAQKAEARKVAERAMMVEAGPGAKKIEGIVNPGKKAAAPSATGGKTISMADIQATARASGKSAEEVRKAAEAKGYKVQ